MSFNQHSRWHIALVFLLMGSSLSSTIEALTPNWRKALLVRAEKQFEALLDCVTLAEDLSDMVKGENLPFSKNQKRANSAEDCLQKVFVLDFRKLVKLAYDVEEDNEKLINKTLVLEKELELLKSEINLLQGDNAELMTNLTVIQNQEISCQIDIVALTKNLTVTKNQEILLQIKTDEMRSQILEMRARLANNTWDPDIFLAIAEKNETALHFYVELGADVNARDIGGNTPLQNVSQEIPSEFSLKAVKYLIENGANVYATDDFGYTFLSHLFERINQPQFDYITNFLISQNLSNLFNFPADWGKTPFQIAVKNIEIRTATLSLLHENGVDFNAVDEGGHSMFWLRKDSVLGHAVRGSRTLRMISDLVNFGAKTNHVNKNGESLLHIAAMDSSEDVVKYFIELGMDVNALDKRGRSPLMNAVDGKAPVLKKVRILVQNGANVKIKYEGKTILERVLRGRRHFSERARLIQLLRGSD